MPLINCEINLFLIRWANCVISEGNREITFAITDTKLYVPVVTLTIKENTQLLQQLKSALKCTISWDKYQSKVETQGCKLDYLIDRNFQGVK